MRNQKGNALFLILIAVALFAALSIAATQTSRGIVPEDNTEKTLTTAQILNYAAYVKQLVAQLTITRKCADDTVSFENPMVAGYINPNSPGDNSCDLFDYATGAHLDFRDSSWFFTGAVAVDYIATSCLTSGCSELMLIKRLGSTDPDRQLCLEINDKMDIPPVGIEPPSHSQALASTQFQGDYTNAGSDMLGSPANGLEGHETGCFKEGGGALDYIFYHVLIAR